MYKNAETLKSEYQVTYFRFSALFTIKTYITITVSHYDLQWSFTLNCWVYLTLQLGCCAYVINTFLQNLIMFL